MQHVAGELFKIVTGVNMVHVPYRSLPAGQTDLIGGQVQVMFDAIASSIEFIRTGKLRALAVTTATRLEALPDVPTVGESSDVLQVADFEHYKPGNRRNSSPFLIPQKPCARTCNGSAKP
jgi:tripartite-type tricarboxylate transporter receptor subunit TctC